MLPIGEDRGCFDIATYFMQRFKKTVRKTGRLSEGVCG